MALFTPLSFEEARTLVSAFGLELTGLTALEQGSVNSNFRLETRQGWFFARIYEEQLVAGALAEMQLIRELAQHGVPTPAPLKPQSMSEPLIASGKPFAIYPWVEGEILCGKRTTPQHLEQVGAALARLHLATDHLSQLPQGRFETADLERRLDGVQTQIREAMPQLQQAVEQIKGRLGHYAQARSTNIPQGIIHGDLFRDNALWNGEQLSALIDFESASSGTFAYDIMVCVHAWCFGEQFDLAKVRALLEGYGRERKLSPLEVDALPVEGAIAALRFATTRITDFSLRAAPGTEPKRDYRRFLERLRQIEAGALSEPLAEIRG